MTLTKQQPDAACSDGAVKSDTTPDKTRLDIRHVDQNHIRMYFKYLNVFKLSVLPFQ